MRSAADSFFPTEREFERRVAANEFIEQRWIGHRYGTTAGSCAALEDGKDGLFAIDLAGDAAAFGNRRRDDVVALSCSRRPCRGFERRLKERAQARKTW